MSTLVEALRASAGGNRGICFIEGSQHETFVTYRDLYQDARYALHGLQTHGIAAGDEVVLQLEDTRAFLTMFWACLLGGMLPVPLAVGGTPEHKLKLTHVWRALRQPFLASTAALCAQLEPLLLGQEGQTVATLARSVAWEHACTSLQNGEIAHVQAEDIAFIQFSSGSTGAPKGVTVTHRNVMVNLEDMRQRAQIATGDAALNWMPLTHDMGLICGHLLPLLAELPQLLMPPKLFIRHPILWLQKASEHRATILYSPNFGYQYFLSAFHPEMARTWDLTPVRLIYNGAEPIAAEVCQRFLDTLRPYGLNRCSMYPAYGLAEATLAVSYPDPGQGLRLHRLSRNALRIGQSIAEAPPDQQAVTFVEVGAPMAHCQVRICDDAGRGLDTRTIGHIQIRGASVMQGYYNNPEATRLVLSPNGWLETGDLGFLDDGHLVVTGRAKDIIVMHGHNYYPHDLERLAEELPAMQAGNVVACGIWQPRTGTEDLILFVRFKASLEAFLPLAVQLQRHVLAISFALFHPCGVCNRCSATATSTPVR